ncbi:carbohydrate kinase family protein [Candidatus Woesearchaeota archaeon]|nr:carbohydrate kinase family protein [Candidatus Woesearchaeota archaeon]
MIAYNVITVGSATIDVFAKTHSELIKIRTETSAETLICYPSGSKILIHNLQFLTGGGGTNTGTSFARLGVTAAYLGHLGNDENGHKVLNELKRERVAFIGTFGKELTNYSFILDSLEHDRAILAYKEASDMLRWKDINKNKLQAKWFYISSMMGESYHAAEKLVQYARQKGIHVAFNPSEYQAKLGVKKLQPLLSCTNVLVLNREEAALLLGKKPEDDIKTLLLGLLKTGPSIVVITEGKKGAHASDGHHVWFVPARQVKVVDSTGAGDSFASAFVAGLMKRNNIEFALQLALVNAESVVQVYGAKPGLLRFVDAMHLLRKKLPRVVKTKI